MEALEKVRFLPNSGKARLESFVNGRSEWCISRQRAWGVPIPALYRSISDRSEAVMTGETVEHIIKVIEERGIDAWWTDAVDDKAWIPSDLEGSFVRGKDTMDVWFDSGTSWTTLPNRPGSPPADVYVEGTDQHRGWFQSSLLTHVAYQTPSATEASICTNQVSAPYKTLITHGFTLDEHQRKMSKSLGNVISPDEIMNGTLLPPLKRRKNEQESDAPVYDGMGSDALRLWVASSDYTHDVVIGQPVLKAINSTLQKYRVTFKWFLGVLSDYPGHGSANDPLTPKLLDAIALQQLRWLQRDTHADYTAYEPFKAVTALNKYINVELSAFFMEAVKDTMYAGAPPDRLRAQHTCYSIFPHSAQHPGANLPAPRRRSIGSRIAAATRHPRCCRTRPVHVDGEIRGVVPKRRRRRRRWRSAGREHILAEQGSRRHQGCAGGAASGQETGLRTGVSRLAGAAGGRRRGLRGGSGVSDVLRQGGPQRRVERHVCGQWRGGGYYHGIGTVDRGRGGGRGRSRGVQLRQGVSHRYRHRRQQIARRTGTGTRTRRRGEGEGVAAEQGQVSEVLEVRGREEQSRLRVKAARGRGRGRGRR